MRRIRCVRSSFPSRRRRTIRGSPSASPTTNGSKTGPAHAAAGSNFKLLDLRRVEREGSLDAYSERLLPHGEGFADTGTLALDHHAFEYLRAFAVTLDDEEVNANAVSRGKGRKSFPQLAVFDVLDYGAHCSKTRARLKARGRAILPKEGGSRLSGL